MQSASAYLVQDRVVVHANSQTTAGVWIATDPVLTSAPDDFAQIGANVRAALAASQSGVAHPAEWRDLFTSVLQASGVRSYKTFMTGAKHAGIEQEGASLVITAYRNLGPRQGFEELPGRVPLANDVGGIELGSAIVDALAVAE